MAHTNHWANQETTIRFVKNIIILYVQAVRWILSAYNYICSSPDIVRNEFRKASAIEDGIEAPNPVVSELDHDPFESNDDPDC